MNLPCSVLPARLSFFYEQPSSLSSSHSHSRVLASSTSLLKAHPSSSSTRNIITIINPFNFTITYKIRCTKPEHYSVQSDDGTIPQRSTLDIVIKLKPQLIYLLQEEKQRQAGSIFSEKQLAGLEPLYVDKFRITITDAERIQEGYSDVTSSILYLNDNNNNNSSNNLTKRNINSGGNDDIPTTKQLNGILKFKKKGDDDQPLKSANSGSHNNNNNNNNNSTTTTTNDNGLIYVVVTTLLFVIFVLLLFIFVHFFDRSAINIVI